MTRNINNRMVGSLNTNNFKSLIVIIKKVDRVPMINMITPSAPKRCIGRFPYFDKNQIVIKSRKPLIKRFMPNFDSPYFRA